MIANLIKAAELIALKVNQGKTKYLEISRKASDQVDLQVDGYVFNK